MDLRFVEESRFGRLRGKRECANDVDNGGGIHQSRREYRVRRRRAVKGSPGVVIESYYYTGASLLCLGSRFSPNLNSPPAAESVIFSARARARTS